MRTVNAERHAEKRAEILEAAGRCFLRNGFHRASISAICAEAGISPGHLYHYFDSKEAIITALVEDRLDNAARRYQLLINVDDIVPTLLAELERYLREEHSSGFTLKKMMLSDILGEASRNPAIAALFTSFCNKRYRYAADLLRKGQASGQIDPSLDPDATAELLISTADAAETWSIRNPDHEFDKNFAVFRTMLERLLTPPARHAAG
ncbi:TetR/AcrR family transcriptional regulator [Sphingomonas sp.]|uniref:TetR/AcrR family transcriptional regulator n=1 Tax=Sphingomonas sp. TaxID=28214 RepID=UPI003B3A22E1